MDTRTLCLGVLAGGEASGYEIKKALQEEFGLLMEVSHSSIYPALNELLHEGMVSCLEVRQEGKPDKKIYRLTDAGERALAEGLARSPARHKLRSEFLSVLMFAEFLPADRLRKILDERQDEFRHQLGLAAPYLGDTSEDASIGVRFVSGLGDAVLRAVIDYIDTNRGWLEAAAGSKLPSKGESR